MLDWFSGYVGYDASALQLGRFFEVDAGGDIVRNRDRWETARGSFESGVQVTRGTPPESTREVPRGRPNFGTIALPYTPMLEAAKEFGFLCSPEVLRISGNPSKFLQGHNAAGPSVSQLGPVLQALVRSFGPGLRPGDADDPRLPAVHRSRVDIAIAVDLDAHQAVHDWLRLAATTTRSRHGRALDSKGTVYWGQTSKRWTIKAYCKHCELQKHRPRSRELLNDLLEWTRTHLRIELTLRRPELKDRGSLTEATVWEFFERLEVHTMKQRTMAEVELRPAVKAALQVWYDGHELSCFYPRNTYYRHRRAILKETGIDVSLPRVEQPGEVMPVLLGLDELRDREVHDVPERIQRSLFGAGQ